MGTIYETLVSWQFVLFCLGIAAVTFVVRKIVEVLILDNPKMPGSKSSKFWTELFLPVFPVIFGTITAYFLTQYPYPTDLNSMGARTVFGLVSGFSSGLVYRIVKSFVASKFGVNIDEQDKK